MVRQAAERLCTYYIVVALFYKLSHFSRKKPALAHFYAAVYDLIGKSFSFLERCGGYNVRVRL